MNDARSAREHGGLACTIGVPVLLNGTAIAALNLMCLSAAANRADVPHRPLLPPQAGAINLSQALARSEGPG